MQREERLWAQRLWNARQGSAYSAGCTVSYERLEAAIEHGDPAEARRIAARYAFSDAQRRHVDRLIDDWERDAHLSAENRFLPRLNSL